MKFRRPCFSPTDGRGKIQHTHTNLFFEFFRNVRSPFEKDQINRICDLHRSTSAGDHMRRRIGRFFSRQGGFFLCGQIINRFGNRQVGVLFQPFPQLFFCRLRIFRQIYLCQNVTAQQVVFNCFKIRFRLRKVVVVQLGKNLQINVFVR